MTAVRAKGRRRGRKKPARRREGTPALGSPRDLAARLVAVLLLAVAVLVVPPVGDAFRAPKLLLGEWLALTSLLPLAWELRRGVPALESSGSESSGSVVGWLLRQPAVQVALPLLAAAALSTVLSPHPRAALPALADLAIAAAALVGWSAGLGRGRLRGLLAWLLVPGALLAVVAVLQFHGLFRPFLFAGGAETSRLGVTSLAGNPGDLGAFLALVAIVAQAELLGRWREEGGASGRRWVWPGAVLALALWGGLASQTLTALAALTAGSLVFWALAVRGLPVSRRRLLAVAAGGAAALALVVLLVAPVRERVAGLGESYARGGLNAVLTGRLDGWRVAGEMARERPWTGVGHGAFEAAFGEAKLALVEEGTPFYRGQGRVTFANAHNEVLEVAAEWGLVGLLALVWALGVVARRLWRWSRRQPAGNPAPALAWGGVVCLAVLSWAHFPFRLALVAYPALVLLAWILVPAAAAGEADDEGSGDRGRGAGGGGSKNGASGWSRATAWGLLAVLLVALGFQTRRIGAWYGAATRLRAVEVTTHQLLRAGRLNATVLWRLLDELETARRLDPGEAAISQAEGSLYRLLQRPEEAREAYRRALELEQRPETWLNLGAAQDAAGDEEEAMESFGRAVRLDPGLRPQVPRPYRQRLPSARELYGGGLSDAGASGAGSSDAGPAGSANPASSSSSR